MNYIKLLWRERYMGFLIILLCAALGSIRGAVKENGEFFIGVTKEDEVRMDTAGKDAPELVGVIPLAAEQNRWRNFSYALHYAGRGVVCYGILTAVYLSLYHSRFCVAIRTFWAGTYRRKRQGGDQHGD